MNKLTSKIIGQICIAAYLLLLTCIAFGGDYCKGYTRNITTPPLHKLLSQAEQAYKQKNYTKACEFIDKALANQSATEFSSKNDINGPLAMQLKAAKARYKFLANPIGTLNPEIKKMSTDALKEYHKAAKGKKWDAYESFYHRLVQYYNANKNSKKAEEYLSKIYDYNPNSGARAYLYWGMGLNLPTKKVEEKVNTYLKSGGLYSSYIMLMRIRYKDRDGENVFQDSIDFLKEHPNAHINELITAIELFRKSIDLKNPKQVKQYYNVLNKVAFAQPGTEEGLKLVSRIIDERKKVDMIFEKVRAD